MDGRDAYFVRAIRGPVTLITVGVLFALNNFTPYRFEQTWPVLLIVFGLLSLLRRGFPRTAQPQPGGAVPPYNWTPPAGEYAGGSGSYRQSQYPGTAPPPAPQGPVKGGFGGTAQRPAEPENPPAPGEHA